MGLGRAVAFAQGGRWTVAPALAALALLMGQPALFTPIKDWYSPLGQPLAEKAARYEALEREVAAAPGAAVLGEDAWLALKAGKALPYDDPAMMAIQANSGRWDQTGFLADIARRKFGLLILEHDITGETFTPRWSAAALAALQANYAIKHRDVRFLQAPLPPPAAPPRRGTVRCPAGRGSWASTCRAAGGASTWETRRPISLYWGAPPAGVAPQPALKFSLRLVDAAGAPVWQADLPPRRRRGAALAGLVARRRASRRFSGAGAAHGGARRLHAHFVRVHAAGRPIHAGRVCLPGGRAGRGADAGHSAGGRAMGRRQLMKDLVFLAPHLDDVALSCGGLAAQATGGRRVRPVRHDFYRAARARRARERLCPQPQRALGLARPERHRPGAAGRGAGRHAPAGARLGAAAVLRRDLSRRALSEPRRHLRPRPSGTRRPSRRSWRPPWKRSCARMPWPPMR